MIRKRLALALAVFLSVLTASLPALPARAEDQLPGDVRHGEDRPFRIAVITYASLGLEGTVKQELARLGYVEGQNVDYRGYAGGRDMERTRQLAREMMEWKPDLIISLMTNAHVAVQEVTREAQTPVVLWSADPLGTGVIESFSHPGTNFTGFSYEPWVQELEVRVLKWVRPDTTCIGHLWNHTYAPAPATKRNLERAGAMADVRIVSREALEDDQIVPAIEAIAAAGCSGFVVGPHELLNRNGALIGQTALAHGLAAISIQNSVVENGGLAAYTPPFDAGWKAMAPVIVRLLHGADPASIPIERGKASPFVLNLDTARKLGVTLPAELVDEANVLIEGEGN